MGTSGPIGSLNAIHQSRLEHIRFKKIDKWPGNGRPPVGFLKSNGERPERPRFVNRPTLEVGRGPYFRKFLPIPRSPPTPARIDFQAKPAGPRLDELFPGRHPDRLWCLCRLLPRRAGMAEATRRPGFVSRHDRWIDSADPRRRTRRRGELETSVGGARYYDDCYLRPHLCARTELYAGLYCQFCMG